MSGDEQEGHTTFGSVEVSEDKNANMAMDVPIEEDYEQELAEVWDDIDGQELKSEEVRKARAQETEWYRKMNVREKRSKKSVLKRPRSRPSR